MKTNFSINSLKGSARASKRERKFDEAFKLPVTPPLTYVKTNS